jgi:hypothetical protein
MATELEVKQRKALCHIRNSLANSTCYPSGEFRQLMDEVDAILNPPPIMEPVEEIVGWVNVYQWKDGGRLFTSCVHGDEGTATRHNAPSGSERISCQPIKVTVQREKKAPVEFAGTYQISSDGRVWHMDGTVADELHDKVVLAAWTEEPT